MKVLLLRHGSFVFAMTTVLVLASVSAVLAQVRATALLDMPGTISEPDISPDGQTVVFSWCSPDYKCGLYTRTLHGGQPALLVADFVDDHGENGFSGYPRWSPDANWIAFNRATDRHDHSLWIVPATGGTPRRIGSFCSEGVTWTLNSQNLVVAVYHVSGEDWDCDIGLVSPINGEVIRVLVRHGTGPSMSPDGKRLAYVRTDQLRVLPLRADKSASGDFLVIREPGANLSSPVWISGGKEILYLRWGETPRLRRVTAKAGASSKVIDGIDGEIDSIAVSPDRTTLLAGIAKGEKWRWRLDLQSTSPQFQKEREIPWTDDSISLSRDGRLIVFRSDRGGIWSAGSDGSSPNRLTRLGNSRPKWSPDTKAIAFNFEPFEGNGDSRAFLYTAAIPNGTPRRLLPKLDSIYLIGWSNDGEWIYYSQDERLGGPSHIWKVRLRDEKSLQVTRSPGFFGQESPDGKYFYFVDARSSLIQRVAVDGKVEEIVSQIRVGWWWTFAVGSRFLYFVPESEHFMPEDYLARLDLTSGAVEAVCKLAFDPRNVELSGDERFLYAESSNDPRSRVFVLEGVASN